MIIFLNNSVYLLFLGTFFVGLVFALVNTTFSFGASSKTTSLLIASAFEFKFNICNILSSLVFNDSNCSLN